MDTDRDLIDFAVLGHQAHQGIGGDVEPALFFIQIGDGRQEFRLYVLPQQLKAGMHLPGVGGIAPGQPGLQHTARRRAAATRHRGVDDLHIRVDGAIGLEQRIQGRCLATRRPPREYLELALRCPLRR